MPRSGASQLLIHAVGPDWSWVTADAAGQVLVRGRCDPATPDWPTDLPTRVLVDARVCTPLLLELPELSGARLDQALRWAAEEYLAGAADEEHVVAAGRTPDGRTRCVVVADARMDALLAQLNGLEVRSLCPDALCLPWSADQISLAAEADSVLMRWGEWQFGGFDQDTAAEVLGTVLPAEAERVWLGGERPPALRDESFSLGQNSRREGLMDAMLPAALDAPVNLLSGRWRPRDGSGHWKTWRWAAALAATVVLVAGATPLLERQMLRSEAAALQVEIDQRFSQAFPGLTPAGRHRELAERELARLRFGQSAGLLDLMHRTAPVLAGQADLVVEGLSFRDGQLELRVRAADVAGLDELERRLRSLNLNAALQSASLDGQGASGRLRVSEQGR